MLHAFGLPLAAGAVAHTADEAAALARRARASRSPPSWRRAACRTRPSIGAVRLNLTNDDAVRAAFDEHRSRARRTPASRDAIDGVLIQPMITGGVETMIGVAADPLFGPLVGFGLGGIHVEVLGDVRFRIAPLTDRDADELLREIRGFPLLQGYRGQPGRPTSTRCATSCCACRGWPTRCRRSSSSISIR